MPIGIYKRTKKMKTGKHKLGKKLSIVTKERMSKSKLGKKLSIATKEKMSKSKLTKNNGRWEGNGASYEAFHKWLSKNYGKPKQCKHCEVLLENYKTAKGLPSRRCSIQYALIKYKEHNHKQENYICLCYKCHKKYDTKRKRTKNLF